MLRKIYLIATFALISSLAFAQTGSLKGVVVDVMSGEPIPFANVVAERNGNQFGGTTTDFDGNYTIKPLDPGNYTIKATFVGYGTVEVTGVVVSANKITMQNVSLQEGVAIGEVKIIAYKKPLLDQDNLSGETKTAEEIVALPTRSVASVAATTAGIYQRDEGDDVNMRGSRSNTTTYYIDGIKVVGASNVPTSSIEQITVVTGGLPAKYGDATGGIISITTKGPSSKTFGGIELVSSSLFDNYNYNLLGFSLSGPIYRKRDLEGKKGRSVLGYFISGELKTVDDSDPSAIGVWKVKDDVLAELQSNPFRPSDNENAGLLSSSEFLSKSDFENVQGKSNQNEKMLNLSAKIDIMPGKNTFLTLGGTFFHESKLDDRYGGRGSIPSHMFNWDNNRQINQTTFRAFAKLTQKFGNDDSNSEESSSLVKNAFFTMQADYSRDYREFLDPNHKFELFDYGYVGKFKTDRTETYSPGIALDTIDGEPIFYTGYMQTGYRDTLLTFTPGGVNSSLETYTNAYYDLYAQELYQSDFVNGYGADGIIRTAADLKGKGLLNGQRPENVYSLFRNHGYMYNGAAKLDESQTSFKAAGSADIKSHEISFGFEYEEREEAYWGIGPMNMWSLMRSLSNLHLLERDLSKPIPLFNENGIYQDTVHYDQLFQSDIQSTFDRNLRTQLGLDPDGTDYLDIDSYDRDEFDITMFSQDELLNSGSSLVYYYGYDAYGNSNSGDATLKNFFEGNERLIAPYNPVYTAGYVQDKFAIRDLLFSVGVRVDRFDANQQVLKDKYLLYDVNKAGTTYGLNAAGGSHPSTIGDDFVVYVDDFNSLNPTAVGYRNKNTWYNSDGLVISDPKDLAEAAGGSIQPYLSQDGRTALSSGIVDADAAFEDYSPEVILMPRLAFSFPISDEAQFFAHYDVLTQRPKDYNLIEPVDYLFMADRVGALLNNPNLKPEKTIDYELGFAKTLSLKSALKISAFYKEIRDQIQVINVLSAYPAQYQTFGNVDFGTVKGLSVNYDLRRTNNVKLTANYTLQFADGTGSSARSGESIANTGQPNLRTTNPLNFDQRHAVSASVDYHYSEGKDYNGPVWFGLNVFANAGANLMLNAGSGTPYSRQSNITQEATYGISEQITLDGSLYGSRLPWQFRMNAKIDKSFEIKWSDKKSSNVTVYIQVQNLLNAKNIIYAYRATGNPNDDGYLTSEAAQNNIASKNDEESFRNLYSLAVNHPSNYSMPRMWRAGISVNF
jgi:outer membrane receptor for ferrienterochelin and colicin